MRHDPVAERTILDTQVELAAAAAPEAAVADQQLSGSKRKRAEAEENHEGEMQEEGANPVIVDTKRRRFDGEATATAENETPWSQLLLPS